jgi:hypothetical protein
MPRQSGHHRVVTRAPPSSVRSQCGGPPTASIPKTSDQLEEPNSKRSRPSGNNASTEISRVPPTHQQMQRPTSDRQHTPHPDAGTTTASAHTKNPNGVRVVHPRPADSTPQSSDGAARNMRLHSTRGKGGGTLPYLALQIKGALCTGVLASLRAAPRRPSVAEPSRCMPRAGDHRTS